MTEQEKPVFPSVDMFATGFVVFAKEHQKHGFLEGGGAEDEEEDSPARWHGQLDIILLVRKKRMN